ncbi:hypothetical protein [Umezawaea tangerina]|uniref:hypothetical protein n=1 Tax=Umezawaea tangerina TaxID=84725 RepID=UPI0011B1F212|nr:hypothetical protein [Umezawaea tangerina]
MIRFGVVRQVPAVGRRTTALTATAAVLTLCGLVAAPLVGNLALLQRSLLVTALCVVVLVVLGVLLRTTLPTDDRRLAGGSVLWPLVLPMRAVVLSRTADLRFLWVKDITGVEHECAVRGRWAPSPPAVGDIVDVYGRRTKSGVILLRHLVSTTTGDTTTGRPPTSCTVARATSIAIIVVWAAAAASTVWSLIFRN